MYLTSHLISRVVNLEEIILEKIVLCTTLKMLPRGYSNVKGGHSTANHRSPINQIHFASVALNLYKDQLIPDKTKQPINVPTSYRNTNVSVSVVHLLVFPCCIGHIL